MGRRSIFRDKEQGRRVQAVLSKAASKGLDAAKLQLASLYTAVYQVQAPPVSDADAVMYLCLGYADTRFYLIEERDGDVSTNKGPNGGNRSATTTREKRDERTKDYQKGRRPQSRA